ncbi:MAG: type II secretion system protein, partial [Terriglobales bacterium]
MRHRHQSNRWNKSSKMTSLFICGARKTSGGFTLIELIVATTILTILTGMAIPLVRITIK